MNKKTKFWVRVLCWVLAGLMVSGGAATLISVLF